MRRVSVVGNSGSGKSTLARQLAEKLDAPHLELDGIFHQPRWEPLAPDEFRRRVRAFVDGETWVVDGNYVGHGVAEIVWSAADTVVWLDLPRHVVMRQIIGRTLRRLLTRQVLWNGNRESGLSLFKTDPEQNIVLWSWTRHAHFRAQFEGFHADGTWDGLRVVRLRSRGEVEAFLDGVGSARGATP